MLYSRSVAPSRLFSLAFSVLEWTPAQPDPGQFPGKVSTMFLLGKVSTSMSTMFLLGKVSTNMSTMFLLGKVSTNMSTIFLLGLVVVAVQAQDYCSISPSHTACPTNNPKVPSFGAVNHQELLIATTSVECCMVKIGFSIMDIFCCDL